MNPDAVKKELARLTALAVMLVAIFGIAPMALAGVQQFYRIPSQGSLCIDEYTYRKKLSNLNPVDIFIPTNTEAEWVAVLSHGAPGLSIGDCAGGAPVVVGCMTPGYDNYNPGANSPGACSCNVGRTWNGSACVNNPVPVVGCMTPGYDNYNPNANSPGSCSCNAGRHWNGVSCVNNVYGCMDPNANNYDPNANINQGCTYNNNVPITGCMTPGYDNYNPSATSPGACSCNAGRHWNGSSCVNDVLGCMTSGYDNYDSSANVAGTCSCNPNRYWTGSACENIRYGCMTPGYDNYDPSANHASSCSCTAFRTFRDGSCQYDRCSVTNACGASASGTFDASGNCSASMPPLPPSYGQSCTKSNACFTSSPGTYDCNGSCSAPEASPLPPGYGGQCSGPANACGQTSSGSVRCDGSCSQTSPPPQGCTDPNATNYNASATCDDGSCIYPPPPPCRVQLPIGWGSFCSSGGMPQEFIWPSGTYTGFSAQSPCSTGQGSFTCNGDITLYCDNGSYRTVSSSCNLGQPN